MTVSLFLSSEVSDAVSVNFRINRKISIYCDVGFSFINLEEIYRLAQLQWVIACVLDQKEIKEETFFVQYLCNYWWNFWNIKNVCQNYAIRFMDRVS